MFGSSFGMFLTTGGPVGLGWVPIAAGCSTAAGLIIPYIIAVREGHVYPILPLVSQTGILEPERCYFAQLMNIASVLTAATAYLVYKNISDRGKEVPTCVLKWNSIAVVLGYLSAFGLSLVANFQMYMGEESQMELQNIIHFAGAVMCLGIGILYGALLSRISYALATDYWSRAMALVRTILTVIATGLLISTFTCVTISMEEFDGTLAEQMMWKPGDKGYRLHLYGSISEYLLSVVHTVFIVTFYKELKAMTPRVEDKMAEILVKC